MSRPPQRNGWSEIGRPMPWPTRPCPNGVDLRNAVVRITLCYRQQKVEQSLPLRLCWIYACGRSQLNQRRLRSCRSACHVVKDATKRDVDETP